MKLSILIPVYNEARTVETLVQSVLRVKLPCERELVAVDDASTDGSWKILERLQAAGQLKAVRHERNQGKGAAIRTALASATGDVILIQDADLEYDPQDYPVLLAPIIDDRADVVYGSRFLGGPHRVLLFWHYLGNVLFTLLTNVLYNVNLTDMGVGYKVFRASVLKSFSLKSDRFGFEPEVTAKVCKKHLRLYEVPISYSGRTYAEGKKITWRDGFTYGWCLLKFRLCD
ncbi:MAG: glycosyltransferase family 2 protein [Elusimicrobia bacterium]|nr:glycosyltransferase family 2 protein [Elusimicrobiota bacterium]